MDAVDILLLSGSTRSGSTNTAALDTCAAIAPSVDGRAVQATRYLGMTELPHFDPGLDIDPLPPPVAALRAACTDADAFLVCTPEYAGALPGSFKNLLEWTIGGSGLYEKPVGWINVSAGPTRAADAHASLALVLRYAGAQIVADACRDLRVRREDINPDGLVTNSAFRTAARAVLTALASATAR